MILDVSGRFAPSVVWNLICVAVGRLVNLIMLILKRKGESHGLAYRCSVDCVVSYGQIFLMIQSGIIMFDHRCKRKYCVVSAMID